MAVGRVIGPAHTRRERQERAYRDALRELGQIARDSLAGTGPTRVKALMDIDRISSRALREGV